MSSLCEPALRRSAQVGLAGGQPPGQVVDVGERAGAQGLGLGELLADRLDLLLRGRGLDLRRRRPGARARPGAGALLAAAAGCAWAWSFAVICSPAPGSMPCEPGQAVLVRGHAVLDRAGSLVR